MRPFFPSDAIDGRKGKNDSRSLLEESRGFRETAHDIETLHRLPGGALDEIVFRAQQNEAAGARVNAPRNVDEIRARDVFRVRRAIRAEKAHERFVAVCVVERGRDFLRIDATRERRINCRVNAARIE